MYRQRISDKLLQRKLKGKGAVLVEGPKWCGKTTSCEQVAGSVLYMDAPGALEHNVELSRIAPNLLLKGPVPRLIDEWQLAPKLWDAVRFEVDHRSEPGQFILTGSAVPADTSSISHSGIGRFAKLTMRPMSLYESLESTGDISLSDLFSKRDVLGGKSRLSLLDISYAICRGGWPGAINIEDKDVALDSARDYYDLLVDSDISRVDGVSRNPQKVKDLLRSYARNQGAGARLSVIGADLSFSMTDETIASYLNALRRIFVVEDMPAWNPNLRSKTAIRTTPTRYFVDPSIAAASLGLGPDDLVADLNTFGLLFETLCVRDLRVYAAANDGEVYHYRDANGLECDAVVHLRNGNYGLVEIKLGGDKLIEEGCRNLLKLSSIIDTEKMMGPSFLMILTAVGDYAYRRSDGVYIVPIGSLKD